MSQPRCVCLTAPTASGKTQLALWLAQQLPVEIISMDSAMVFRGMDIGTAKPTLAERAQVPHHLIDICDPTEHFSAGRFVNEAHRLASEIAARDRIPLFVGGTMMYLRALRSGLAALPRAHAAVRAQIDAEADERGWAALHARLNEIDPAAAARIEPGDRQRIQRALEVWRVTGRTLTAQLAAEVPVAPLRLTTIALLPPDRSALHAAIAQRFDAMLARGFLQEVDMLRRRNDLHAGLPALRCVGYRQIRAHLDGEYPLETARARATAATRQLAKRQLTWLRSDPGDFELPAQARETPARVLKIVADSCR
ncbi:MAG: tRNA (adenosine(37)-N6)-dimethylallyltransferase MiaA, partial [Gammaproteobacteria bacterium]